MQNIHARLGNARRDFLHKATTAISQNHAMVCIEDLQVRNMSKSAKGSTEKPGKNAGAILVAVPPHNTSRACPACGHVAAENRQRQAHFECVDCGYRNNADVVGAMNVLARGHRVAACGEEGSGSDRKTRMKPASVKQEPTEATMCELAHA
jgi:putative transposase